MKKKLEAVHRLWKLFIMCGKRSANEEEEVMCSYICTHFCLAPPNDAPSL
jgi:hypothetical protein